MKAIWDYLCSVSYWGFELADILAIVACVGSVGGMIAGLIGLSNKKKKAMGEQELKK